MTTPNVARVARRVHNPAVKERSGNAEPQQRHVRDRAPGYHETYGWWNVPR